MPTKFFEDKKLQKEYENKVNTYVNTFKSMFKNYIPEFHDSIVEELVRTEISMRRWERMIYHDQESKAIISLLENDRKHYNSIMDKMMIFLKSLELRKSEDTHSLIDKINTINDKFLSLVKLLNEVIDNLDDKHKNDAMEKFNDIVNTE